MYIGNQRVAKRRFKTQSKQNTNTSNCIVKQRTDFLDFRRKASANLTWGKCKHNTLYLPSQRVAFECDPLSSRQSDTKSIKIFPVAGGIFADKRGKKLLLYLANLFGEILCSYYIIC
jgi:hypothetical protein